MSEPSFPVPADEPFPESPSDIVLDLRSEQYDSWRDGQPVPVEVLLDRCPALADDDDAVIELLYSEFQLREQFGEQPQKGEYFGRFPGHRARLERLFELHEILDDPKSLSDEAIATLQPLMPVPVLYRNDQPPERWSRVISEIPLVVGRDCEAAIRLNDPSISRHHCLIWRDGTVCRLEDAGSTNGVLVNGARVRGGCELYPGDVIRIAKFVMVLGLREE
jgi:FHA domain